MTDPHDPPDHTARDDRLVAAVTELTAEIGSLNEAITEMIEVVSERLGTGSAE